MTHIDQHLLDLYTLGRDYVDQEFLPGVEQHLDCCPICRCLVRQRKEHAKARIEARTGQPIAAPAQA